MGPDDTVVRPVGLVADVSADTFWKGQLSARPGGISGP